MTRDECKILVKALRATYTNDSFIPDADSFNVWFAMLEDLPYQIASKAVQHHIQSSDKIPTIANIRKRAAEIIRDGQEITDGEAWSMVSKAICRSGYNSEEEFSKLPEDVQRSIGDARQLFVWSQMDINEVETVVQSQFLRSYRAKKALDDKISMLPQKTARIDDYGPLRALESEATA